MPANQGIHEVERINIFVKFKSTYFLYIHAFLTNVKTVISERIVRNTQKQEENTLRKTFFFRLIRLRSYAFLTLLTLFLFVKNIFFYRFRDEIVGKYAVLSKDILVFPPCNPLNHFHKTIKLSVFQKINRKVNCHSTKRNENSNKTFSEIIGMK